MERTHVRCYKARMATAKCPARRRTLHARRVRSPSSICHLRSKISAQLMPFGVVGRGQPCPPAHTPRELADKAVRAPVEQQVRFHLNPAFGRADLPVGCIGRTAPCPESFRGEPRRQAAGHRSPTRLFVSRLCIFHLRSKISAQLMPFGVVGRGQSCPRGAHAARTRGQSCPRSG